MATTKLFEVEGGDQLIANVQKIEAALLAAAPKALEEAAEIPLGLMKRLVPKKTMALHNSIRFTFGKAGGEARTTGRPGGRGSKKTRVVGFLVAGNEQTIVGAKKGGPSSKKGRARKGKLWQNAALQEFGTQKMAANPYFFPAWRASKTRFRRAVTLAIGRAFKAATQGTEFAKPPKIPEAA